MKNQIIPLRCVGGAMLLASLLLSASAFGYEKEIKDLSAAMANKIAGKGKQTVAVVDFNDLEGNVTQLDRFIAEEFSVALAGAGKGFKVIDRTHLKAIIKENKLSATGLIDPATIKKLGKIVGVDALITGTLTPFGDNMHLAVKILDTETAEIIDAITGDIAKTKAIDEMLGKEIESASAENGETKKAEAKPAQTKKEKGDMTQEVNGFSFNLKGCKISGETLVCNLFITSVVKDNKLALCAGCYNYSTVIYDDVGNEYWSSKVSLGEHQGKGLVERRLVYKIQTSASFEFNKINKSASMLSLFEMECASEGENFTVQFRNVPISK